MCSNICPSGAISMEEGLHGFIYPRIDGEKCINCNLCVKRCPANTKGQTECTMKNIYAAWNISKDIRKKSTSGGICSLLENEILKANGAVVGVEWDEDFCARHTIAFNNKQTEAFRGSKYVQSNTGNVYSKVGELLDSGKKVLFAGTPCQIDALKSFLKNDYEGLFTVDFVCHGVPSHHCFKRFLSEISSENNKQIDDVKLRYKAPYWDYCSVRIDFEDGSHYQRYTVDDPYFTLFNIGYSLRESCHSCKYTSLNRVGDITLADFWGYQPKNFKMADYNKGISLVAVNTQKGEYLMEQIKEHMNYESETLEAAIRTNKSFQEPYVVPENQLNGFWDDYEKGFSIHELCKKYVSEPFKLPNLLFLRRMKNKYRWVIKQK